MAAVAGVRQATATLVAATADTVTLSGVDKVGMRGEISHHGDDTTAIYFRVDGTAAVSAADENEVLLSGERVTFQFPASGAISVISAGTPTYTVSVIS